jgi:hypothetical protein
LALSAIEEATEYFFDEMGCMKMIFEKGVINGVET